MTLKNTVESITQTAVTTAVTAARHPFGTAARATGLVKDTAGVGIGLVRSRIGGAPTQAPAPAEEQSVDAREAVEQVVEQVQDKAADLKETAADVTDTAVETIADVKQTVSEQVEEAVPAVKKAAAKPAAKKTPTAKPAAKKPAATKAPATKDAVRDAPAEDPRDQIPGPDLAAFAPPAPEDLPEPIVIEAE